MSLLHLILEYNEIAKTMPKPAGLSANEQRVLDALSSTPQTTKEISEKVGLTISTVLKIMKRIDGVKGQSFGTKAPSLWWKDDEI